MPTKTTEVLARIERRLATLRVLTSQPLELYGANGGYSLRSAGHRDILNSGQVPLKMLAALVDAYADGVAIGFDKGAASVPA